MCEKMRRCVYTDICVGSNVCLQWWYVWAMFVRYVYRKLTVCTWYLFVLCKVDYIYKCRKQKPDVLGEVLWAKNLSPRISSEFVWTRWEVQASSVRPSSFPLTVSFMASDNKGLNIGEWHTYHSCCTTWYTRTEPRYLDCIVSWNTDIRASCRRSSTRVLQKHYFLSAISCEKVTIIKLYYVT